MCVFLSFLFSSSILVTAFSSDTDPIKDFDANNESVDNENPAAATLCYVILLTQGRIGRAIAMTSIAVFGLLFFLGKVTWPSIVIMIVGIVILFGARQVALLFLDNSITVNDPNEYGQTKQMTPDQIIQTVCPEL